MKINSIMFSAAQPAQARQAASGTPPIVASSPDSVCFSGARTLLAPDTIQNVCTAFGMNPGDVANLFNLSEPEMMTWKKTGVPVDQRQKLEHVVKLAELITEVGLEGDFIQTGKLAPFVEAGDNRSIPELIKAGESGQVLAMFQLFFAHQTPTAVSPLLKQFLANQGQ